MENTAYAEAIIAARSILIDPEEAADTRISIETQTEMAEDNLSVYIEENFPEFLRLIRYLSKSDQDLLLCYFVLGISQTNLAIVHRTTQTLCSEALHKALSRVGTYLMFGTPTEELMRKVFSKSGVENTLPGAPLSKMVVLYSETRSYDEVARQFKQHRPAVRRTMRKAAVVLADSEDHEEKALGAFLDGLVDKTSAEGKGMSKRQQEKANLLYFCDPPVLGKFRITIGEPGFSYLFTSRANCLKG